LLAIALAAMSIASRGVAADGELHVARRGALPSTPAGDAWQGIAATRVALLPQDMVEPRQLHATTTEVSVRAISDGTRIAFLLEWSDTSNDDAAKPAEFTDACAVQLPRDAAADVPAPQMGEAGRAVEITYWRASWQASVDGRPDTIAALYPGASVDHYPFEAPPLDNNPAAQQAMALRYAPARAAGNDVAGPRQRAVEDLVAEGPGSLAPAKAQTSTGSGVRTPRGWAVVLARPLPASLSPGNGQRSQVAFAVWDGAHDEVGARKMRSAWVPLALGEE
jgi:hypothetical protein